MGMNVIAFDIFHIPGIEEQTGINYVEMDELLAKSDFISVHAPAVDGGAIINAANIAKMKDGVVIINPKNEALYSHPHVSCTPHIGASTTEAQKRIGAEIVDIIGKFFA